MPVDTMVMLELLEEAGEEAVTLDELEVAGVRDPAQALLELELAGLAIQRVIVRGDRADRELECIRLAQAQAPDEQPTAELAAVAAPPVARESHTRRLVTLAVLLALVALLLRRG